MPGGESANCKSVVLDPSIVQDGRTGRGHLAQVFLIQHPFVIAQAYVRGGNGGTCSQQGKRVGLCVQWGLVILRDPSIDEVTCDAYERGLALLQALDRGPIVPIVQIREKRQVWSAWNGVEGFCHGFTSVMPCYQVSIVTGDCRRLYALGLTG